TVSNLTAATQYSYYPTWITDGHYQIAWAPGDTGTPTIAMSGGAATTLKNQAVAFQLLAGREQLTAGAMTYTQPVSGTNSGGGGGGGSDGKCIEVGTQIIPLGGWAYVTEQSPETVWMHLRTKRGMDLVCTLDHPLYSNDGRREAQFFSPGMIIF